jgi:hypothetical protein
MYLEMIQSVTLMLSDPFHNAIPLPQDELEGLEM